MLYINKKTGAKIDVKSKISGGNWQLASEESNTKITSMTKAQLIEYAKASNVEATDSMKKNEIINALKRLNNE